MHRCHASRHIDNPEQMRRQWRVVAASIVSKITLRIEAQCRYSGCFSETFAQKLVEDPKLWKFPTFNVQLLDAKHRCNMIKSQLWVSDSVPFSHGPRRAWVKRNKDIRIVMLYLLIRNPILEQTHTNIFYREIPRVNQRVKVFHALGGSHVKQVAPTTCSQKEAGEDGRYPWEVSQVSEYEEMCHLFRDERRSVQILEGNHGTQTFTNQTWYLGVRWL